MIFLNLWCVLGIPLWPAAFCTIRVKLSLATVAQMRMQVGSKSANFLLQEDCQEDEEQQKRSIKSVLEVPRTC
jgi:hypothetical protein